MKQIYAGDGLEHRFRFYSDPGNAIVSPGSVSWRLECETTGKVLQDWTAATMVADYSDGGQLIDAYAPLDLDGTLNMMQTQRPSEVKRLLVAADRGGPRQASAEFRYTVKKLASK
jgi:hypothetical protein